MGGGMMSQLTQREFLFLEDLLHAEQLEVIKYQDFAQHVSDPQIKESLHRIAGQHQQHFNRLLQILNQSQGAQNRSYGTSTGVQQPAQQSHQSWGGAPSGGFTQ